jgi:Flp pilus assembly pilin Flp
MLREGVNTHMLNDFKHFASSLMARVMVMREDGQALVEYSLILALVSVAAIITLGLVGGGVVKELEEVVKAL